MRASNLVAFSAISAILPYVALANEHAGHARRHHDIARAQTYSFEVKRDAETMAKRDPEVLSKRYDGARFTFYDVGL